MSRRSPRDPAGVSAADYDQRKAFLEFGERDAEVLRRIGPALASVRSSFVDQFYDHLSAFPETRALLSDPATLERLKRAQAQYFDRLLGGEYGRDHAEECLRIGTAHHRVGVEPKWYLGSCALYLRLLLPQIWRAAEAHGIQPFAALEAIIKAVFLDMGIAIDTYRAADNRHIVELKRFSERIVASVPAGLLVVDAALRVIAANRSFIDACGCAPEALVGCSIVDVLGVPDLESHVRAVLETGEERSGILCSARCPASGVLRPVRVAVTGIEPEEEERLLVVVENLSKNERLGVLARAEERRFQAVIENITDGIVLMGATGFIEHFNRAAEWMFGYLRDEVLGRPVTMLMPEAYREAHKAGLRRYWATGRATLLGKPVEVEGLRKDGTTFPVELTIGELVVDGRPVFAGTLRDITARRAAAEQARLLAAALDAVGDPVTVTDRNGVIEYVNPAFTAQNGYTAEEAIGAKPSLLKSGRTDPAVYRDLWDTVLAGRAFCGEVINRRKDGSTYAAELSVSPVYDGARQITHFVGTHRDITARKSAEDALRRSEESFRMLIERSPDAIAVHRHGRFVYVNSALCGFLGYVAPDDLIGRSVTDIVHPEDREAVFERIQTMLRTGSVAPPREERFLRRDGTSVTAEVVALPLVFHGEPAIVAVARDLTERKQLISKMMQMDRMVTVGTLASGVAHEINTPVQFVSDSVHFLRDAAKDVFGLLEKLQGLQRLVLDGASPSVLREAAEAAAVAAEEADLSYIKENVPKAFDRTLDGLERVASIVRSMKEFAHPGTKEMSRVDLRRSIQSTLTVARNEYKYVAEVETELGDIPEVMCHEADINEVVLNLIVNAAQAIGEVVKHSGTKGRITIRTQREGDEVVIAIADTGNGIPAEIRGRIFDPFFTTKEVGKGTGQGLAIARTIVVDRHGGSLTFESEVGKGTTFYIRLPIQEPKERGPA